MDLFDTALLKQLFAFGKSLNGTEFSKSPKEAARVNNKQFLDVSVLKHSWSNLLFKFFQYKSHCIKT
jgi:hypothetical protein